MCDNFFFFIKFRLQSFYFVSLTLFLRSEIEWNPSRKIGGIEVWIRGLFLCQNLNYSVPSLGNIIVLQSFAFQNLRNFLQFEKLVLFHLITMLNKLVYLKCVTYTATSSYPFIQHYPLLFSLRFLTATSNSRSFAVSYLIHNFGFSPDSASKISNSYKICFRTPEKPDSVISFFRNRGFSIAQINHMVRRTPWLLSCDPCKRLLPKFEFLLSKGVSRSEIVDIVSKRPEVLGASLKNHIVPTYELIFKFLKSDVKTVSYIFGSSFVSHGDRLAHNVRLLLQGGVRESRIATLLGNRGKSVFISNDMVKLVKEVRDLGFDPTKVNFVIAMIAINTRNSSLWKEKVDTFKKWGWSDEAFSEAFRRFPRCMLTSIEKMNVVMNFWVNELGWDALDLARCPGIFGYSMEKTIIPRARVVQHLLAKGLRKNSTSFLTPFWVPEKVFLEKFVTRFKKESCTLLKLYQEKVSVQVKEEVGGERGSSQRVNSWVLISLVEACCLYSTTWCVINGWSTRSLAQVL